MTGTRTTPAYAGTFTARIPHLQARRTGTGDMGAHVPE